MQEVFCFFCMFVYCNSSVVSVTIHIILLNDTKILYLIHHIYHIYTADRRE